MSSRLLRASAHDSTDLVTVEQLEAWLRPLPSCYEAEHLLQAVAGVRTQMLSTECRASLPLLVAVLRDVFPTDSQLSRWLLASCAELGDTPVEVLISGDAAAVTGAAVRRWCGDAVARPASRRLDKLPARFAMAMTWLIWAGWAVFAVPCVAAQTNDLRADMSEVLRYAGVAHPVATDVDRMVRLWTDAQRADLPVSERHRAYRELLATYSALQGGDTTATAASLDANARFAAMIFRGGGRMDLRLPPRGAPGGTYLHIETHGNGDRPLMLISDVGVDGRELYGPVVRAAKSEYTVHVVTLPFAGRARALPWPEQLDYARRPWLEQVERELLAFVDGSGASRVAVVGTAAGGYFAVRLALQRPHRVGAVVLVNALVNMPLPPGRGTTGDPRMARLQLVRSIPPAPQLWPVAAIPEGLELRRLIEDTLPRHPSVQNWMAFAVKDTAVSRAWTYAALSTGFFLPANRYRWELTTTDLTDDLQRLSVPTLAVVSRHDAASPMKVFPAVDQWAEMTKRYPTVPLTIVTLDGTRAYVSADEPARFRDAIMPFLRGASP